MLFLKSGDTINGKEGIARAIIDGRIIDLFYLKDIEAVAEKKKKEINVLNKSGTQHKANGWNGTGSCTLYYITSEFRKLMIEYIKTGKDVYFDLLIGNNDKTSSVGKQTIMLYDCNLDNMVLAKLDVEEETLEEEFDFTFSDVDLLDEFGNPVV